MFNYLELVMLLLGPNETFSAIIASDLIEEQEDKL